MSVPLPLKRKNDLILVHTLSNKTIKVPKTNIRIVSELKQEVCKGSCVLPSEIVIVSKGAHLDDDQDISYFISEPIYAFIKCTSHRNISLAIKHASSQLVGQIECSLNSKISRIKYSLAREKKTTIRPCEQRAIICGQVLKDHHFIGDYLLHSKVKSTKTMKRQSPPHCTIVLSRTVNPHREVDIALEMPNLTCINFSFPIGEALYYAKTILFHQYGVPNDLCYNFRHESGVVLSDHDTLLGRDLVSPSMNEVKLTFTVVTELMLSPHHIISLPSSLLDGGSDAVSAMGGTAGRSRSHSTGDTPRGTAPVTASKGASQPLFKGLKKGFLSGSNSKATSTSTISVSHPAATAAAARRAALDTKDIWNDDDIPTYEELVSGEWRSKGKKSTCKKRQRPVRNASTLSSRFAKAIAKETPREMKDKNIKTGERIRDRAPIVSPTSGTAPSKQPEPVYNIRYKLQDGLLVKSFSPGLCTHIVIKIHFPQSKLADIDLNVTVNKIKVASPLHQLITPLLVDVQHRQAKAKFDPKREILTVTLPVMM